MRRTLTEGVRSLRLSVSLALAAGLSATAPMAIAQDEPTALDQRVQVTGSRIKRVDVETTSPVISLTAEDIRVSGHQSVADVLRGLNVADSLGLTNISTATNAGDGTRTVSLRDLGSQRTLILVNGRRWLSLGGGQVDVTQIPIAMIQRVEVLTDGASAIYGSDAIGGVINFILRDDYDGLEVNLHMGGNFEGDGEVRTFGATYGVTGPRSGVALDISKTEQNPIWAGDREISKFPVAYTPRAFHSAFGEYGLFGVPCSAVPHITTPCPASGFRNVALSPDADQGITNPADRSTADFQPIGPDTNFNFAPTNLLLLPSDDLNLFTRAHYDVTDTTRLFAQVTYHQRKSMNEIAAVPLTIGPGTGSGPQWRFPVSADNLYNPFGVDITQAAGFRMSPLGAGRRTQQDYDTYFVTTGLEGMVMVGERALDWDVVYSRGESSRHVVVGNLVNLLNLERGLGPSFIDPATGMPTCGTPDNPTPQFGATPCVPINLFNGVGGWTQEMADYVSYDGVSRTHLGTVSWVANVSGDIVDLPAGPLAFAAGLERRTNTFNFQPDSLVAAGLSSANFTEPTFGEQTAEEAYIEFAIPLVREVPGARMLELSVAARYSDYDNDGFFADEFIRTSFDNTSLKFGVLWQPFEDLLVRANRSDTFRAPSVQNLFQGGGEGHPSATDPCASTGAGGGAYLNLSAEAQARCHADGVPVGGTIQPTTQLRQLSGGNPELLPEEGETYTLGVVYNPSYLPGFDMSLDAWRVDLNDALAFQGAASILNQWYVNGNEDFRAFIDRDTTGQLNVVRASNFNLNNIRIQGADLQSNYRFDTNGMGSFHVMLSTTYTHEARFTPGDVSQAVNLVGRGFGALGGPTWRWRGNARVSWMRGDYGLSWTTRWFSPLIEECGDGVITAAAMRTAFRNGLADRELCSNPDDAWVPNPNNLDDEGNPITQPGYNRVPSIIYHDIAGSWRAPWNATVHAGVRNVFDKDPPFMTTPFAHSFDQAYDIPGPFWFISYRQAL